MQAKRKPLTINRSQRRKRLFAKAVSYYRRYPDRFIEELVDIKLNLYQKILVRAFFVNKYSMWVLSRGLGKSWLGGLCLITFCILYPNTYAGVIAPSFRQARIVIIDKLIKDILDRSPFLRGEVSHMVNSNVEVMLEFHNGSRIKAVPMGDGNKLRGERFHIIMADEYAQIPKEILDLVVGPMMNVKRNYEVGKTDYDDDIGNRLLITSSAYYKHNNLWTQFKLYVEAMADGKANDRYFVAVLPYQVGIAVGLFDEDHIEGEKTRLSPLEFDMEYGCVFLDTGEGAWIDPNDLVACSTIKHIELEGHDAYEYVMGIDVARVDGGDNTVIKVLKIVPRKGHWEKHDVFTLSLNGEKFETQAMWVRRILKMFPNIKLIGMDTSGLGVGLVDELSKEYFDIEEQKLYPPLIDRNDEEAVKSITNGIPIIHGIKPNAENNHNLGMIIKSHTQKKWVRFYAPDAGDDKLTRSSKEVVELTIDEERQILEAEATRRELMGIQAKPSGNYLKFETPNPRQRKDRWSALGYALIAADVREKELRDDSSDWCVGSAVERW